MKIIIPYIDGTYTGGGEKTLEMVFRVYNNAFKENNIDSELLEITNFHTKETLDILSALNKKDIIVVMLAYVEKIGSKSSTFINILNLGNPIILINSESVLNITRYPWSTNSDIYRNRNLLMVLDYEYKNIELMKEKTVSHYYCPPCFSTIYNNYFTDQKIDKDIDILFYGSCNNRRLKILKKLIRPINPSCTKIKIYIL